MRKLYLLLDEWDGNRNFVGEELKLICKKYKVTVICNSAYSDLEPAAEYLIYSRPSHIHAISSLLKGLTDRDMWQELHTCMKYRSDTYSTLTGRISEAVRFYINADLFRNFMRKHGCLEDGAIYYSYWNFWKCYAVTHEKNKYKGLGVISRIHGYDLYDEQLPSGYQPFKNAMDEGLDRLIFISETGKEHYLKKFGKADSNKYGLYLLGTDRITDRREPDPLGERIRPEGEFLLVSCSRIDNIKRVERIAEALSLISDIRLKWVHFGTGILEESVKEQADKLLADKANVSYEFMGQTDNSKIHEFYAANRPDAFVTASSSEGNPVSVMEAMSYGIPVIAPAICNFPNMLGGCGKLVDEKCEASDLAEAIKQICLMPGDEAEQLRESAYRRWDESFNARKNNRCFIEEVLDTL